jgi:hypothetical protein
LKIDGRCESNEQSGDQQQQLPRNPEILHGVSRDPDTGSQGIAGKSILNEQGQGQVALRGHRKSFPRLY